MAIHASPGAYFETTDYSLYAPQLSTTNLALVGKTAKGPTKITHCTTVRQFTDTFGIPRKGDFSALGAVSFLESGSSLWFKRLVGSDATKATVEIPKAVFISDEIIGTADNTGKYLFNATLNHEPVSGTVELKIVDPESDSNYIVISDSDNGDGTGVFSPFYNSAITNYSNFIDYDTGECRFTLSDDIDNGLTAGSDRTIIIEYNKKEYNVTNESAKTITAVSGSLSYSFLLKYSNITPGSSFALTINSSNDEVYTFTMGEETATDGTYILIGKNADDDTVTAVTAGSNIINTETGFCKITFASGDNLSIGDVILATYKHTMLKSKTVGTIGATNADGSVQGLSFIGSLNNVIFPGSVSIKIQEADNDTVIDTVIVANDNSNGKFIADPSFKDDSSVAIESVVTSNNTINYKERTLSVSLVTPPANGFILKASYMAKYSQVIYTATTSVTDGVIAGTMTVKPIVKNSLTISFKDNKHIVTDDGEGNLVVYKSVDSTGVNDGLLSVNGTVDYENATINLSYIFDLVKDDDVTVSYLSKFANAKAVSVGNYYNNTKIQFFKDSYYGYGLKVWNPDQYLTQNPYETWKNIVFDDSSKPAYFNNKIISSLIEFDIIDANSSEMPVLNTVLTLTGGDDDAVGINESTAIVALNEFANYETYDVNLMACPDFPGSKAVISALIDICEVQRGDCFAIVDTPAQLTPQEAVDWHNGDGRWANENAVNSSFTGLYYPWLQILDSFTESLQWVPPSVKLVSVFAYNDSVTDVWNAPAGLRRGRIYKTQQVERVLTIGERDLLYATGTNAINPIYDKTGDGIVVYGQKTTQRMPSALDRINVSRLIIYTTKVLATAVKYLNFEPNDEKTWLQYKQLVEPFLANIKTRRGLYEFKIICDSSTNTPFNIDNNTMIAEIWLKPTKTAERIITRFNITSTGASLSTMSSASA